MDFRRRGYTLKPTSKEQWREKDNKEMRISFIPPSEEEFRRLFLTQPLRRGGGLEDISVFYPGRRRGGGILSSISGIAKRVLPFLFKAVKPSAREFGRSLITDMITKERPLKESIKKHGIEAARSAGLRILNGSGRIGKKLKRRRSLGNRRATGRRGRLASNKSDVYELL